MDIRELNEIVALKDLYNIDTALKNRGWVNGEDHPIVGDLGLVDLFNGKELLSSKEIGDKEFRYKIDVIDDVKNGERWLWAVLYWDKKVKRRWLPGGIRIYVKEKTQDK